MLVVLLISLEVKLNNFEFFGAKKKFGTSLSCYFLAVIYILVQTFILSGKAVFSEISFQLFRNLDDKHFLKIYRKLRIFSVYYDRL